MQQLDTVIRSASSPQHGCLLQDQGSEDRLQIYGLQLQVH